MNLGELMEPIVDLVEETSELNNVSISKPFLNKKSNKIIKQRKYHIEQLHKSSEQQKDDKFIRNQEKCLIHLKRLAEKLKGHKIENNCFQTEDD